jgi:glycosyltransferase involved in cell wall biosynthesis
MASDKKKILVFVDWFYPGFKGGGPIRSCINIVQLLKEEYDIKVVTRDTDLSEDRPYPGIISDQWVITDLQVPTMYLSRNNLSFSTIKRIIREEQPAHVYINSMYSLYFTIFPLLVKKLLPVKPVYTVAPRGMLYDSATSKKAFKKKLFFALLKNTIFSRNTRFHVTNEREGLSVKKYFPCNATWLADNLPPQHQEPLRVCDKQRGSLRCVFVARIDPIKNLLLLLTIISKIPHNIHLTIIGPIDDQGYWEACNKVISTMPANINIEVAGTVSNDEVHKFLINAHLFVLLTQGENFGHAILESFLAGRPVLISDQTPWRQLEKNKTGWDMALDNTAAISEKIIEAVQWDQETFTDRASSSWKFASGFLKNNKTRDNYFAMFN